MPSRRPDDATRADATLTAFACPNEDCSDFNRFGAGNLSVCERMGKDRQIRRLYCRTCGHRFSERQGTLLQYAKLPEETIVRIVKCLVHGCSVEATADICEVTPRTVESLLKRAGRRARGRRKHPDLKPPPGLLAGIVSKLRDATGNLVRVKRRRLFGRLKDIRRSIEQLGLGHDVNTAHIERINGTMRTQQTRLARRTRNVSRADTWLERALSLWHDWYHWIHVHASLAGRTPAMAMGLADHPWTALEYVHYPVHVGQFQRAIWSESLENLLTSVGRKEAFGACIWGELRKNAPRRMNGLCAETSVLQERRSRQGPIFEEQSDSKSV